MLADMWRQERLLVTVKAYPNPSRATIESSCTACVTREGEWIRLFPLNWRRLRPEQRFRKYDWITARIKKSRDPRPESYYPDVDSIRIVGHLGTGRRQRPDWAERAAILEPRRTRSIEELRERLAPAFVFIDPFGPMGFPFGTVSRIMRNPHSEVFIRFNYTRFANTFLARRDMEPKNDDLYGCQEWRNGRGLSASEKERYLIGLYVNQLRQQGGIQFVQPFRTVDTTGHVAYFIFATNNSRGFEEMKEAMWKVDPDGLFRWRASARPPEGQLSFGSQIAHGQCEDQLAATLPDQFAGRRVAVRDIEEFVRCQPDYLIKHLRPALRRLEAAGQIVRVEKPSGGERRKTTFPAEALVTFA